MKTVSNDSVYDVIIIGGGATGAGTARDCALRGLKVLLIERHDIATGATGRNHGLLHSGARYAVTDRESAEECIKENMTLKKIARHCVEKTDGFFLTLPEDDLGYQKTFIEACRAAGIEAEAVDPKEALIAEPSANPAITGAVRVPDGSVDPFRLTSANIIDAKLHGAHILVYSEVTDFIFDNDRVVGVKVRDHVSGEETNRYGNIIVNAAGIWGAGIVRKAGISINMFPAKGSLLIFGHRVNNVVLNRCRKPANADILVPGDTICVIGTTSDRVPYDSIDDMRVTPEEVDLLLSEGMKLAPSLEHTRIIRAYAGVRPLVAMDDDPSGRNISRGIVLLDHETRDGVKGLISITGGKLMTYRLMAEMATDLVCAKLGVSAKCVTATEPLPGSRNDSPEEISDRMSSVYANPMRSSAGRHGDMAKSISHDTEYDLSLVCECEDVSLGEVEYAIENLDVHNLVDLRRRTRVGMGTCQGELCACRAAGLLAKAHGCASKAIADLRNFMNERWKGMYPVSWGETLRENEYTLWVYAGVCGMNRKSEDKTENKPEGKSECKSKGKSVKKEGNHEI